MIGDWVAESRWFIGSYVVDTMIENHEIVWPVLPIVRPETHLKLFSNPDEENHFLSKFENLNAPVLTQRKPLEVSFFGVHATLLAEPISMLDNILSNLMSPTIFMRDCPKGHTVHAHHCDLQCQVLGDCVGDGTNELWTKFVYLFV